jgi:hypothetical protein
MLSTPIYTDLVAELGEPPTGAPTCICDASPVDCALHPLFDFRLGEPTDWATKLAALDDEAAVCHA